LSPIWEDPLRHPPVDAIFPVSRRYGDPREIFQFVSACNTAQIDVPTAGTNLMLTILIIALLILLLAGGGGYYGRRRFGGRRLARVLGLVLIIIPVLWIVGALGPVRM
jgi:hypothetical protein